MNTELKKQAHKKFDNWFDASGFDHYGVCGCFGVCNCKSPRERMHREIDSLIDETVLSEQERIVGIIEEDKLKKTTYSIIKNYEPNLIEAITIPESYESAFNLGKTIAFKEIISLITNKSDINKDK